MFTTFITLIGLIWTTLATCTILRQDTNVIRTIVELSKQVNQILFPKPTPTTPGTAEVTEDDSSSDDSDEIDPNEVDPAGAAPPSTQCSQLRITRQIVRPATTAGYRSRTTSSAAGSTFSPRRTPSYSAGATSASTSYTYPPLEFALELQWSPPPAVLEGQKKPITYEIQVEAAPDPNSTNSSTKSSHDSALSPNPSSTTSSSKYIVVVDDTQNSTIPPPAPIQPQPQSFTLMDPLEEKQTNMDIEVDEKPISVDDKKAGTRKRKVAASRTKAPSKSSTRCARTVGRWCGDEPTSTEGSSLESNEPSPVASSEDELAHKQPATLSEASELSSAAIRPNSTFEHPAFVLQNPLATSYTFRVQTVEPSSQSSILNLLPKSPSPKPINQISQPFTFNFQLPSLLFLIQSLPRSPQHALQILQGYKELFRHLRPEDDLAGIDWTSLTQLCEPSYASHINRRVCRIIGKLADFRQFNRKPTELSLLLLYDYLSSPSSLVFYVACIVRSLCVHAPFITALQHLAEHRIHHLMRHHTHPSKRQRSDGQEIVPPAAQSTNGPNSQPMDTTMNEAPPVEDETYLEEEGEVVLLEPILENLIWFVIGILRLTQPPNLSSSTSTPPSALQVSTMSLNQSAVIGFIRLGGLGLFQLLCQQSNSEWFFAYDEEAIKAMIHVYSSYSSYLSASDRDGLLFHLLHQSTFGSDEVRAILQRSNITTQLKNPFQRI